ncbi:MULTISPECIES: YciI family protein [unclassified Novosphingobium]|uniref:YciI family protein n=1 Tax=unclassified Novosphingobium TaxID=2644732 RepID=UPI00135C4336|nr:MULTISPECIES: YciI family protein [unclassified Novosphingobium]
MASFIISLTYTASIDKVDALLDDHVAWLRANHAAGHLLGWGRKVPRDGGILLAKGESRDAVAALAAQDPFVVGGVAEIDVIEWAHGFLDDSIAGLAG